MSACFFYLFCRKIDIDIRLYHPALKLLSCGCYTEVRNCENLWHARSDWLNRVDARQMCFWQVLQTVISNYTFTNQICCCISQHSGIWSHDLSLHQFSWPSYCLCHNFLESQWLTLMLSEPHGQYYAISVVTVHELFYSPSFQNLTVLYYMSLYVAENIQAFTCI